MEAGAADRGAFVVQDVTVNINTVQRPDYLDACLRSLLATTPQGVPLQILFNGTPPEIRETTMKQAAAWRGPTNFIILDEILPIAESHDLALEAVQTPLVNFMGDDDVVLGDRLPLLVDAFNSIDPAPVVVTSFAVRIAGDAFEPSMGSFKELGPTSIAQWQTWHASGKPFEMVWPAAVLDVAALRSIGGFEASFGLAFDTRVFSQMSFLGPVLSITDRQFGFRIHQGSVSTSNWKGQRETLRYVQVCHLARLKGDAQPTLESFREEEAGRPWFQRFRRDQRDRSQLMFRTAGEQWVAGERLGGAKYALGSVIAWPPAFLEKVRDQRR